MRGAAHQRGGCGEGIIGDCIEAVAAFGTGVDARRETTGGEGEPAQPPEGRDLESIGRPGEEFLELALQDELVIRKERSIARRTKAASFRELKLLPDFDWSFNTSIKKKQIYDLATCKFIEKAGDLLLLGPPSVPT